MVFSTIVIATPGDTDVQDKIFSSRRQNAYGNRRIAKVTKWSLLLGVNIPETSVICDLGMSMLSMKSRDFGTALTVTCFDFDTSPAGVPLFYAELWALRHNDWSFLTDSNPYWR